MQLILALPLLQLSFNVHLARWDVFYCITEKLKKQASLKRGLEYCRSTKEPAVLFDKEGPFGG